MADPGTMIGIVSLAGQILRGLKSLHTFFEDIKDAPKDIGDLKSELVSIQAVLDKILDQFKVIDFKSCNVVLDLAMRNCADQIMMLENMIRQFRSHGKISKVWKQMSAAFKKESIQKHVSMLHSARLNLIAAQGTWAIDLQNSQASKTRELSQSIQVLQSNEAVHAAHISNRLEKLESVPEKLKVLTSFEDFPSLMRPLLKDAIDSAMVAHLQRFEGLIRPPNEPKSSDGDVTCRHIQTRKNPIRRPTRRLYHTVERKYHFWIATVFIRTYKYRYIDERPHGQVNVDGTMTRTEIMIMPTRWISTNGVFVTLEHIAREYKKAPLYINVEPIRIVPIEHPAIEACQMSDYWALRRMIETGRASPYDRTSNGLTLLDYATWNDRSAGSNFIDWSPARQRSAEELCDYLTNLDVDFCRNDRRLMIWIVINDRRTIEFFLKCCTNYIAKSKSVIFNSESIAVQILRIAIIYPDFTALLHRCIFLDNLAVDWNELIYHRQPLPQLLFCYRRVILRKGKICLRNRSGILELLLSAGLQTSNIRDYPGDNICSGRNSLLGCAIYEGSRSIHEEISHEPEDLKTATMQLLAELLTHDITILLKHGDCPYGTLDGETQFADGRWSMSYSPTDAARDCGILDYWTEALVRSGHNATDILDHSLYNGFTDLFDGLTYEYSEPVLEPNTTPAPSDAGYSTLGKIASLGWEIVSSIV